MKNLRFSLISGPRAFPNLPNPGVSFDFQTPGFPKAKQIIWFSVSSGPQASSDVFEMPKFSFLGQPWIADKVSRKQFVLDLPTAGIADNIRVDTMGFQIRHYGIADKLMTSGILGLPLHPSLCQIFVPRDGNLLASSSHLLHSVPPCLLPSLQKIPAPRHPAEVPRSTRQQIA